MGPRLGGGASDEGYSGLAWRAVVATCDVAAQQIEKVRTEIESEFETMKNELNHLYQNAKSKFMEVDEALQHNGGGTHSTGAKNKNGFLLDKILIPKVFSNAIGMWRK